MADEADSFLAGLPGFALLEDEVELVSSCSSDEESELPLHPPAYPLHRQTGTPSDVEPASDLSLGSVVSSLGQRPHGSRAGTADRVDAGV